MNEKARIWIAECIERLQAVEGYSVGCSVEEIAKQIGIPASDIIKLNFNENLFIPRSFQERLVCNLAEEMDFRLYPQDEEPRLREKLSSYYNLTKDCFVVGNASDELIDRIIRLFIKPGDQAVSFTPTFAVPRFGVKRQGGEYVTVPLTEGFQLDVEGMLSKFSDKTRLLYLCSPNNPTANQFKKQDIEKLTENFPGIVVLDEAYAEFADYSFAPTINDFENMVVLRTFSKAFGLASLRLGYAIANPSLAKIIREKTPLPFPVSAFTLNMGKKALEKVGVMEKSVAEVKRERRKLIKGLNMIDGIKAFDSQANFILISTKKPSDEVDDSLIKKGILIKKLGKILQYDNCFRVTVGLPEMNEKLIEALKQIQSENV